MTPAVVGLDLSLRSPGIAYADGSVGTIHTAMVGMARIDRILTHVLDVVSGDVDLVVIEGYSFGSQTSHARSLAELGGVIRHRLWAMGVAYLEVAPNTLKKVATGNGHAAKLAVIRAAEKRLGYEGDSDDEADALWLRAIGLELAGHPPCEWTKAQAEGFKVLRGHPNLPFTEVTP